MASQMRRAALPLVPDRLAESIGENTRVTDAGGRANEERREGIPGAKSETGDIILASELVAGVLRVQLSPSLPQGVLDLHQAAQFHDPENQAIKVCFELVQFSATKSAVRASGDAIGLDQGVLGFSAPLL